MLANAIEAVQCAGQEDNTVIITNSILTSTVNLSVNSNVGSVLKYWRPPQVWEGDFAFEEDEDKKVEVPKNGN